MSSAEYYLRIVVLPRVTTRRSGSNEPVEEWPENPDAKRYSAKPLTLNAGEEIRQGVKESSDFLKLEIKGRAIPIEAVDRVKLLVGGRIYRLIAQPVRTRRETIISCESV